MSKPFQGRHVVVTGASGALGLSVVRLLTNAGAVCHVPLREKDATARLEELGRGRVLVARGVETTSEDDLRRFYGEIAEVWASVHCVGGFSYAPIGETSLDAVRRLFDGNFVSALLCSRFAVEAMRRTGRGGRIVNVAARAALEPSSAANMGAYAASKAAVAAFTVALSEEVKGDGILVNAVAPSIMDTPANRAAMPDADFERWPTTEQVAEEIARLASPDNVLVRGGVVPVYGRS